MKQYSHFNRFTRKDAIESSSKGQFRNQLLLRVLNLYLVARFYEELAEILRVKEKASIFELSTFFVCTCMKYEIFNAIYFKYFFSDSQLCLVRKFAFLIWVGALDGSLITKRWNPSWDLTLLHDEPLAKSQLYN